jgi:hypothetical protein
VSLIEGQDATVAARFANDGQISIPGSF